MSRELEPYRDYAFNQLFKMKTELKGIKIEVEDDDDLFTNEMIEDEMIRRHEECKDIISFEQMELRVNLMDQTDVKSAIIFLEKTTETSIKQIVLRGVNEID